MKKINRFRNYSLKAAKIGKKKKVKGFTLVELIVVIAIIGVLAVVLVPNMMKYVRNAGLTKQNDAAAKVAEQANIIAAELDAKGVTLNANYATASVSFDGVDDSDAFVTALNAAVDIPDGTKLELAFDSSTGKVSYVVYQEGGEGYVGLYPNPSDRDGSSDSAKDFSKAKSEVAGSGE